jgi:uncharacterized protein (DUF488 family)
MHHPAQLFTIGHSNHTAETFLQLLQQHGIACLADVRSAPYSRYNRQFNREKFAKFLESNDIAYLWLGDSLGGRRRSDEGYMYDEGFTKGLQVLLETAATQRTAMMCSEEDPRNCHRHNVICRSMIYSNAYGNIQLTHIRGNGTTEAADSIITVRQQRLF